MSWILRSETVRKEISTPFKEGAEAEAVAVAVAESLKLSLVGTAVREYTVAFGHFDFGLVCFLPLGCM